MKQTNTLTQSKSTQGICSTMYSCYCLFLLSSTISISVTTSNITKSSIPEEMKFDWSKLNDGEEVEIHSLLLMDQSSFEGGH